MILLGNCFLFFSLDNEQKKNCTLYVLPGTVSFNTKIMRTKERIIHHVTRSFECNVIKSITENKIMKFEVLAGEEHSKFKFI